MDEVEGEEEVDAADAARLDVEEEFCWCWAAVWVSR
jgi:hypothetical protein